MQTGRQMVEQAEPTDNCEMKAAILVFLEEAVALAVRYAAYKGCDEVQPQHMVACLKVHAQRGTTGLCNLPDADTRLAEYAELLECSDSAEEESDEEQAHAFDRLSDDDMAAMVEFAEARWAAWVPQNPTEELLKHAVERTAEQFQ